LEEARQCAGDSIIWRRLKSSGGDSKMYRSEDSKEPAGVANEDVAVYTKPAIE
jgi:hypothetical protein